MPKKLYSLNDFSGGLNTLRDPADISDNEVATANNVMFNIPGGIQPAYTMSDSSNNKISSYNNSSIASLKPGHGLGYFETDHELGSGQSVSVSTADQSAGSEDGFQYSSNELSLKVNGSAVNLTSTFAEGTVITIEASTFIVDGMSPIGVGVYRVVGHNSNNLVLDRDIALNIETGQKYWPATVTGHPTGEQLILLANPADHKIDVWSVQNSSWTNNAITLRSSANGITSSVRYYRNEDSIRCCDTTTDNDCRIKWYGWVQREHFRNVGGATSESQSYVGYYESYNDLAKPTAGYAVTATATTGKLATFLSGASQSTQLPEGGGFNLAVVCETDEDGLIESGTYEFAQTLIYDGNQESLPLRYGQTLTIADEDRLKALSVNVSTTGPFYNVVTTSSPTNMGPRVSGGRIYIKKQGDDSEYIMLLDIDLTKGCRANLSDDYTGWHNSAVTVTGNTTDGSKIVTSISDMDAVAPGMRITGTGIPANTIIQTLSYGSSLLTLGDGTDQDAREADYANVADVNASASGTGVTLTLQGDFFSCPDRTVANNFRVRELGFLTYEIINGFSSSLFSNAIGDRGEYWKDSVVANNRSFICNVTIKDKETADSKSLATIKRFPDRIMYSMPNRFDTFPDYNFIEAAKGDSDGYVAIESFADRLLGYKRHSLDIINIAGDDRNWFLEDTRQYQGVEHPEAVKKTQYGIIWVNERGLYLYNGSAITNLKEKKISDSDWRTHVQSDSSIIYDEQDSMAFIVSSMSSEADAYMCDLKNANFTKIRDFVPSVANDGISNSVDTNSNNTLIAQDAGSSIDIYQLHRTVASQAQTAFQTKDISFGAPSAVKRVYAVYITYKSSGALTGMFTAIDETETSTDLNGTISTSATNWAKVKLTPSSPITCNKLSIKFNSAGTSLTAYVNDIDIEYRILHRKGT